jgi:hypothetical protein
MTRPERFRRAHGQHDRLGSKARGFDTSTRFVFTEVQMRKTVLEEGGIAASEHGGAGVEFSPAASPGITWGNSPATPLMIPHISRAATAWARGTLW